MATMYGIPDGLGDGGAYLGSGGSSGSPDLKTILQTQFVAIHPQVATSAAMKAIPEEDRANDMICLKGDSNNVWRFDAASSAGASATVLVPDEGTGRWVVLSGIDLATLATTAGAGLIGLLDTGGFTLAATVEAAIAEIYQSMRSIQTTWPLPAPVTGIDIATGAALAVFADGASTTPGTQFTNSKAVVVRWNNHGTPGAIAITAAMPQDLDDAAVVTYHALVSKIGATLADATKLTVGAFEQTVAALHDADTDFGGDTSAIVGDATSKTVTEVILTLALADIHAAPSSITFTIKPKAGTLGTDDFLLHSHWLEYTPKIMAS